MLTTLMSSGAKVRDRNNGRLDRVDHFHRPPMSLGW
jgi:hypothetical protein